MGEKLEMHPFLRPKKLLVRGGDALMMGEYGVARRRARGSRGRPRRRAGGSGGDAPRWSRHRLGVSSVLRLSVGSGSLLHGGSYAAPFAEGMPPATVDA